MKQIFISLHAKWSKMILSGEKKLEFRGSRFRKVVEYIREMQKQGKEVWFYIYETKASYKEDSWYQFRVTYKGRGRIVGKARIGRIFDDIWVKSRHTEHASCYAQNNEIEKRLGSEKEILELGYDESKHKYAFSILEVVQLDMELSELVSYNKYISKKDCCKRYEANGFSPCHYYDECMSASKLKLAPQSFMYIWVENTSTSNED